MLFSEWHWRAAAWPWLLAGTCCILASVAPTAEAAGPTVKDVVEFKRLVQPREGGADDLLGQISPDGRRAFVVTRQASVATDKNRYDILLLDLSPERLEAGRQEEPDLLLSVESSVDGNYLLPAVRSARWVGDRTIVFLGQLAGSDTQVHTLDVHTRQVRQLSFVDLPIVSFDISADLKRLALVLQLPNPARVPGARHIVVDNQSFWSVKFGHLYMHAQHRLHQYFVAEAGSSAPALALGEPFESSPFAPTLSISPDGRWVLAPTYDRPHHEAWALEFPFVARATASFGRSLSIDPTGYFSRSLTYIPRRLVAYRVSDGRPQVVLDAPDDAMPSASQWRPDRLWQGHGESVILAGTHLPLGAHAAGDEVWRRPHIVEYWPDTGRWLAVAPLVEGLRAAYALPGEPSGFMVVDGSQRRYFLRTRDGGWQERTQHQPAAPKASVPIAQGRWHMGIEQDMNRPADIVARRRDGAVLPLTRLNPQFDHDRWGTMRPFGWRDSRGRQWSGGLMVPSGAVLDRPRALVIQTYGFSEGRFYLDGASAGYSSGFAGRAFLQEDMLVLAMPWSAVAGSGAGERAGVAAFMEGVQGAIDELVGRGWVDVERVGILGWSATGERVLNLVTFSTAPIQAASLLDGDANTLFSMAVTYGAGDAMSARRELVNRSQPFGASLEQWVRSDPSLHTDCIRAAVRIESYGPVVLNNWDIYALMRRQHKAAEMILIPEGAHSLSRPSERMVSLQGNVDWHRFWLKGEERTESLLPGETDQALLAQYARWRQMAALKRTDDAKPRCARVNEPF